MGKIDDVPTGVAIPRPLKREPVQPAVQRDPDAGPDAMHPVAREPAPLDVPISVAPPEPEPAPAVPVNPTLRDLYALIDSRISPQIVQRISSNPPPPESRPSKGVQALKTSGRWTRAAMALIGLLMVLGEIFASAERWRGPISQALVIIARYMDHEEAEPLPVPRATPLLQAPDPLPEAE